MAALARLWEGSITNRPLNRYREGRGYGESSVQTHESESRFRVFGVVVRPWATTLSLIKILKGDTVFGR